MSRSSFWKNVSSNENPKERVFKTKDEGIQGIKEVINKRKVNNQQSVLNIAMQGLSSDQIKEMNTILSKGNK